MAACLPLAARDAYEETVLTWRDGPQMLGFTLSHEHVGFLILGIFGTICLYGWMAAFVVQMFLRKTRGQVAISAGGWVQFAVSALLLAVFWIPYGWWQRAAVEFAGPGPRAADQLVAAAGEGQKYLVNALLQRGVKVDARDKDGETALNRACAAGRDALADALVSKGADPNAAPVCRRYAKFAAQMKPEVAPAEPDEGLPRARGSTVTAPAAPQSTHAPAAGK